MTRQFLKAKVGFWGLTVSGALALCAFTITGFLGRVWWRLEITSNFRVQYLACLIVATIVFLIGKKWSWAIVSGVFALVNLLEILPAFLGGDSPKDTSGKSITVLLANVLTSNKKYEQVRQLIRSADPDIIALLETSEAWIKGLSSLQENYPHVVSRPRGDNFGIALFSRLPFERWEIIQISDVPVPTAVVRVQLNERELTVIATHPYHPLGRARLQRRNRQLEAVAEYVRSIKGPVIVVGDLNATPWSPDFKKLLRQSSLRDSRRGRGIHPSWPAHLPWILRIPLDHVLHSPDLIVPRRELGPRIGSDHLPVIVKLSLTRE